MSPITCIELDATVFVSNIAEQKLFKIFRIENWRLDLYLKLWKY